MNITNYRKVVIRFQICIFDTLNTANNEVETSLPLL